MATATPEFTREEIVQRGKEIYYRDILPVIEAGNEGRVIAIDVCSGEFELADDALTSATRLRARLPDAVIYVLRVGYPTLHKIRLRSVGKHG